MQVDDLLMLGLKRHNEGRRDQARTMYAKALELDPLNAEAARLMAVAVLQDGNAADAEQWARRALGVKPGWAEGLLLLGMALAAAGKQAAAEEPLREVVRLLPNCTEAAFSLGSALDELQRYDEAERLYRKALEIDPHMPEALNNLGALLVQQARPEEAASLLRDCLQVDPQHVGAATNLGDAMLQLKRADEACAAYQRTLSVSSQNPRLLRNYGDALAERGLAEEADEVYGNAVARGDSVSAVKRAALLPRVMESSASIAAWRTRMMERMKRIDVALPAQVDPAAAVGTTPFYAAYHGLPDRELMSEAAAMFGRVFPHLQDDWEPSRGRPKAAFVSNFFAGHTTADYFNGLIEALPCAEFETAVFSLRPAQGLRWERLSAAVDHAEVLPETQVDARSRIREYRPDVLLFTELGMSPRAYFLAFSRLARLQGTLYGHPDTSGIPTLDCCLSPGPMEPTGAGEHYAEPLVELPCLLSAFPKPKIPEMADRSVFGHAGNGRVYLAVQSLFKMHPDFDDLIAGILEKDEEGSIALFKATSPDLTALLAARLKKRLGGLHKRVIWLDQTSLTGFLGILQACDVILDTPHFTGGATSYQALGVGAPAVTLQGRFMRGRQTAAMYAAMNIADLTANSPKEYIDLAVSLALDIERNEELRRRILSRNDVLFNPAPSVRALREFIIDAL